MIQRSLMIWCCCCSVFRSEAQTLKDTVKIVQVDIVADINLSHKGINKTTIDSLVMANAVSTNLSDVLMNHTPIFIKSYGHGGLATASFRGTAASHTQVLWNGIPVNSPMLGQVDLSLLPVFFADDISLYYGSSSLVKGSGALGGTITVENKADWNNRIKVTAMQNIASFQNYQTFISLGAGTPRFQSNTRLLRETGANNYPFYNETGYTHQRNAGYTKYGIMQELYSRFGTKNTLSLKAWSLVSNRDLPPLMTTGNPENYRENQKDASLNAVIEFKHMLSKGFWELCGGVTTSDMFYFRKLGPSQITDSSKNASTVIFSTVKLTIPFTDHIAVESGISISTNHAFNHNFKNSQKLDTSFSAQRTEWSGFLRLSTKINQKLSLFALIRQTTSGDKFIPLTPSLSYDYQIKTNDRLVLTGNFARNYHQPTLNDLYYVPGGNPNLIPEEGYTADMALHQQIHKESFKFENKISGYISFIRNWIVWDYSLYPTPKNVKKVLARGFEYFLNASYHLSGWKYDIRANYSFTSTTSQEQDAHLNNYASYGKQLIFIPKHLYNILLGAEYRSMYLNYSLNYTGNRYTTSDNNKESMLPRYLLNNIAVGKVFTMNKYKSDLQFRVNNMFNVRYQPLKSRAMPEINFELMLRINFNTI